jgi:hypothetical protein
VGDDAGPGPQARWDSTIYERFTTRGEIMMQPWTYEITFAGQADAGVCAEFDDCAVIIGPGTTTLHAHVPDQGALCELVQRITGLGLELVYLQLVAPQPEHWQVHAHA